MPASPRYIVVTPARDEADFIGALAETLLSQTVALDSWIVVDDGSDDGTPNVVRRLADADSRVVLLERGPRPGRRVGFGGIESTMVGLRSLDDPFAYDFVANIDADLVLPLDYFERLFREFERDPHLGIAGGHLFLKTERGLVFDKVPDEHVHGATKVYRRECLRDIWPLAEVWGWDAVDR
jgi:glycosyltransferase involved in cell wall biosynthesis